MSRNGQDGGSELNDVRRGIEAWRRRRSSRAMPEELWQAAAALAREHGVSAVATALRLGYGPLKRRARGPNGSRPEPPVRFVELEPGPGSRSESVSGPTIELWGPDGSRLVVGLPDGRGGELIDLATALWRSR